MNKPRISVREGLAGRRIWACVNYVLLENAMVGFYLAPDRIGYGDTPAEAYAEWEAQ